MMTENSAGRGEGLAGLRELDFISDLLHEHAVGLRSTNAIRGREIGILASRLDRAQVKLEAALEAAARLPAEPDLRERVLEHMEGAEAKIDELHARQQQIEEALREVNSLQHQMAIELDPIPQQPRIEFWTRKMEDVIVAALATPSPQALPRKCFNCEQQEGLQEVPLCIECFRELEDVR